MSSSASALEEEPKGFDILPRSVHNEVLNLPQIVLSEILGPLFIYVTPENAIFMRTIGEVCTSYQLKCKEKEKEKDKKNLKPPTCIAISPSQTIIIIGYADGTVDQYVLKDIKPPDVMGSTIFTISSAITTVCFLDTENILICDEKGVYSRSLKTFSGFSFSKPTPFLNYDGISHIITPPIFQLEKIKYVAFANIVCLIHTGKVKLLKIDGKKTTEIFSVDALNCFSFGEASNQSLSFLTISPMDDSEKTKGEIYYFSFNEDGEKPVFSFEIPFVPTFVTFLSNSIVAAVQQSKDPHKPSRAVITLIGENTQTEIFIPYAQSYACDSHMIYSMNDGSLFSSSLVSFDKRMETLSLAKDYESACELCSKAYSGDPWCIIGLPPNDDYRRLQIEKQLASALNLKVSADLAENPSQANEIIEDIIKRWKTMSMRNSITDDFLTVFRDAGKLDIYLKAIIKSDPEAKIFLYKKVFVQALLDTKGIEANKFILKLPEKIAPPASILKYACEQNNTDLMYKVYLKKLDDAINALNVLANNDQYDLVVKILTKTIPGPRAISVIKWLLAIAKGPVPFPRLTRIIVQDEQKVVSLMNTILGTIEDTRDPIQPSQFINALIISIENAKIPSSHPLFSIIKLAANKPDISLIDASLNVIIPRIFNGTKEEADSFQPMLHAIIQMKNISDEFRGKLIPLCEAYDFKDIKKIILMEMKRYQELISFDVSSGLDVFLDIKNVLSMNPESKSILANAILENATLLVSKDVKALVSIISTDFPSIALKIVSHIPDTSVQNYYLRSYLSKFPQTELDVELSKKYCNFICQYFSSEVRDFVLNCKKDINSLSEICKKFSVFDACAIIASALSDFKKFKEYIVHFFDESALRYVDGKDDANKFTDNAKFISGMFKKYEGYEFRMQEDKENLSQAICEIVKNYAVPIYAAHIANINLEPLQIGLHDFCIIGYSFVHFDTLLTIMIGEFGELSLGLIRSTLIELVKDYSYDVDTLSSLTQLVTENESDAYQKYVVAATKGVEFKSHVCELPGCKRRLTDTMQTTVYPCGHIFHQDCGKKGTCPVCHPEKKLDDKVIEQKYIADRTIKRKLDFFNKALQTKNVTNEITTKTDNHVISIDRNQFKSICTTD